MSIELMLTPFNIQNLMAFSSFYIDGPGLISVVRCLPSL